MTEFKPGEIVDITIKGVRVVEGDYSDRYESPIVRIELPINGDVALGVIHLNGEGVSVERVAPAGWPPRRGDLWRSETQGFFAVLDDDGKVVFVDSADVVISPDVALTWGLTLVHREDEQEPSETAEQSAYGLDLARAVRESGGRM